LRVGWQVEAQEVAEAVARIEAAEAAAVKATEAIREQARVDRLRRAKECVTPRCVDEALLAVGFSLAVVRV
jgi:hypothetical protein